MKKQSGFGFSLSRRQLLGLLAAAPLSVPLGGCIGGDSTSSPPPAKNRYRRTYLAANKAGYQAAFTFPDFVNAWGISIRPKGAGGHFWVTAGGKSFEFVGDVSSSSDPKLRTFFQDALTEVLVPGADAALTDESVGKATGTVFNGAELTSDRFVVRDQRAVVNGQTVEFEGSARFLFCTDSGSVSAWTDRAKNGQIVRQNGPAPEVFNGGEQGMQFFGMAIRPDTWDVLWLADFGESPQIRTLDKNWQLVPTTGFANPFATGPEIAPGQPLLGRRAKPGDPVPFNIHVVNNRVFVAYAISQPKRDEAGQVPDPNVFDAGEEDALSKDDELKANGRPNKGKLAEFTLTGTLVKIFQDDGRLNAPWGVAIAPGNFGKLSEAVLVGNFGGLGRIAAYDGATGRFIDYLRDERDAEVGIEGLWGLLFGNGESLGDANALYFAAGPDDEKDGVFGSLRYAG